MNRAEISALIYEHIADIDALRKDHRPLSEANRDLLQAKSTALLALATVAENDEITALCPEIPLKDQIMSDIWKSEGYIVKEIRINPSVLDKLAKEERQPAIDLRSKIKWTLHGYPLQPDQKVDKWEIIILC